MLGGAGCACFHRAHQWQVVQGFEASGPAGWLALVLWWCVPLLLSALSLCLWCISLEICLISRFKGVFRLFLSLCVGLLELGALRRLWGFCTREWLGGLKARGVFAFVFPLLCLYLSVFHLLRLSSGALPLLSSVCPFSLFVGCSCCFLFPYGLYAKRKGAKVCPLRPLVSCCELLYLRIAAAFLSAIAAALWHS